MIEKMNDGQRLGAWCFFIVAVVLLVEWSLSALPITETFEPYLYFRVGSVHVESFENIVFLFGMMGIVYWFLEDIAQSKLVAYRAGVISMGMLLLTGAIIFLYMSAGIMFGEALVSATGWNLPDLKDFRWFDLVALLFAATFFYNVLSTLLKGQRSLWTTALGAGTVAAIISCIYLFSGSITNPSYESLAKGSDQFWWPMLWEGSYTLLNICIGLMALMSLLHFMSKLPQLPSARQGISVWLYITVLLLAALKLSQMAEWINLLGLSILMLVLVVPAGMMLHASAAVISRLVNKAATISC